MRLILEPLPAATFAFVVLCWLAFVALFASRMKPSAGAGSRERKNDPASPPSSPAFFD